jgi:CDP-diacylglycerol--serine O-phosphatidyltransferase
VVIILLIGLIFIYKEIAFMCLCLGYIFFGLFRHWRRSRPARIPR